MVAASKPGNERRTQFAHFRIDGEDFTRLARDMLLSERVAAAYRLVTEGLRSDEGDVSAKLVQELLDGKLQLVGNETDGIISAPDDAVDYKSDLAYIYAGRVRVDGSWWRPCAEVVLGPEDALDATEKSRIEERCPPGSSIPEILQELASWTRKRLEFYAYPGERALQVRRCGPGVRPTGGGSTTFVLFEPTGEPPFWWPEIKTPADALDAFTRAGRTLDKRYASRVPPIRTTSFNVDIDTAEMTIEEQTHPVIEETKREQAWQVKIADIRTRVLVQAAGDLMELYVDENTILSVPRAPFLQWSLSRTSLRHLAPPWTTISPVGLKLPMDDPYHTDWWIGAGLDLDENVYRGAIYEAATHRMGELQCEMGNFDCTVLVNGSPIAGIVGHDIAVFPDLHPERLAAMMGKRAVITAAGGQLAHLAQVAMEHAVPMLLVPDAVRRFPEGTRLSIHPEEGRITLLATTRLGLLESDDE